MDTFEKLNTLTVVVKQDRHSQTFIVWPIATGHQLICEILQYMYININGDFYSDEYTILYRI